MKMPVGKGLSDTQTSSSKGRAASGVVCQSSGEGSRGERKNPVMGAEQPGRSLSKTQTRNSSGVVKQS